MLQVETIDLRAGNIVSHTVLPLLRDSSPKSAICLSPPEPHRLQPFESRIAISSSLHDSISRDDDWSPDASQKYPPLYGSSQDAETGPIHARPKRSDPSPTWIRRCFAHSSDPMIALQYLSPATSLFASVVRSAKLDRMTVLSSSPDVARSQSEILTSPSFEIAI